MWMGWSQIHMWRVKIQEVYVESEEPQPHTRPPSPGFLCQEISPHNSGCKNQQGVNCWKKLLEPQAFPLKKPTHELTYLESLPLSSRTKVAA